MRSNAGILRIGVVGCGGIAHEHLKGYQDTPDVVVTAVYDISERAAVAFAELAKAEVSESIGDLISSGVDAVSICTPPGVHLENCLPFLEEKVPILCEKPLEADATTAVRLAAAVRRHGVIFMTAFCHRFHPPIIELKRLVDTGVLGAPILFRNIFGGYMDLKEDHRSQPELSGGGTMIDTCSHSVDLFRFLVGDPTEVSCAIGHVAQDLPVEDFCIITLGVDSKFFGEITASHSFAVGSNQVAWYGTKGTAVLDYWGDLWYQLAGEERVSVESPRVPNRFTREIRHFVECVRQESSPSVTFEDGLKASRIITAAYQSAAKHQRVHLTLL